LKVACELEALAAFPGRCLVVRPGYIVGPHDPTDRFTYWVRRAAAGGTMLAPGPHDHALQVVDARDLGAFTLDHVQAGTADVFGIVGPRDPLTWGEAVPALVAAAGADTELAWVDAPFLRERINDEEGELPLWDIEYPGLHSFDASKAIAAGLHHRPLAQTVVDTLAWDRGRGPLKVGLTPERERELLQAWATGGGG
jgi:2'-hydroxyisoflavone reductase